MVLAFDFFAFLATFLVLSGGFVHRFTSFYLDAASVDTAAIVSLLILILLPAKRLASSRFYHFFLKITSHPKAISHGRIFFWLCFFLLFLAHVAKHWSLDTHGFDLSFIHQALFHPLRGPFLPADISPSGTALGEHLIFSLIPLTLFTSWFHSDEFLFLIQNLAISIPLAYILFRGPLKSQGGRTLWIALIVTLSNRSLRNALMFDFREDSFAFLGFGIALLSLYRRKTPFYFLGLLIALLSKEHVPLIAPFFCLPILFGKTLDFDHRTRVWISVGTVTLSLAYLVLAFKLFLPLFNPNVGNSSPLAYRFKEFGSTPSDILFNLLTTPKNWVTLLSHTLTKQGMVYLVMLLGPRFMIFTSREAFLFAAPGLILFFLNLVSGHPGQTAMIFHYDLAGIPFLVWGTLVGLEKKVVPWLDRHGGSHSIKGVLVLVFLSLSVSDKWPTFHLTFNMPDREKARAHIALIGLDRAVPVLCNARLSAQVNAHEYLKVRDNACTPEREAELQKYQGYRLIDHSIPSSADCPKPNGTPLFSNREVSIYRYPILGESAKLKP